MHFGMTDLYAWHSAQLEASQQEHNAGQPASSQPALHNLLHQDAAQVLQSS
jgi:hypothetical protein